jgi:ribonuclease P protein component
MKKASQPWRLRKHADYQLVYKSSRKQQSSSMTYFAATRSVTDGVAVARVGLTAGKVLGNAVERNRIKRRMREAVKANLHLLPAHADVVLHPRRQVLTVDFAALKLEVAKVFGVIASRMGSAVDLQKPQ